MILERPQFSGPGRCTSADHCPLPRPENLKVFARRGKLCLAFFCDRSGELTPAGQETPSSLLHFRLPLSHFTPARMSRTSNKVVAVANDYWGVGHRQSNQCVGG